MNRKTNKAPSDLELMLYADGELDADRAAAVEAYLAGLRESATQAPAGSKLAAMDVVSSMVRDRALEAASPADGIADAVMAQIAAEKPDAEAAKVVSIRGKRGPGNDNARGIFALAAIAVAAAAAMMLWGRSEAPPSQTAEKAPVVVETTEAQPAPPPSAIEAPKAEADVMHGVEVAAVDFGAVSGTIFYVPTEAARAGETTTVVWLTDERAGGN